MILYTISRNMKRHNSGWNWFRGLAIGYKVVLGLIIVLIVFRLFLPGIVKNYVNNKLNALPGYTGHVDDIDISLYRGAYVIKGLLLKKKTDPAKYPFLAIVEADLAVEWRALFKGRLVGEVVLNHPAINILATEEIREGPDAHEHQPTAG
jgi:hypothetical protein